MNLMPTMVCSLETECLTFCTIIKWKKDSIISRHKSQNIKKTQEQNKTRKVEINLEERKENK